MAADLSKLAREILEQNQYMAICSANAGALPWASPVVYAYDSHCNLYFVSIPESKHCQNIKGNNKVALAIFDSRQLLGEGIGLQIEGVVKELNITEIPMAAAIYFKRKYPFGKMRHAFDEALKRFLKRKLYRFYKVTSTKVWMNDPDSEIDERVEVVLK